MRIINYVYNVQNVNDMNNLVLTFRRTIRVRCVSYVEPFEWRWKIIRIFRTQKDCVISYWNDTRSQRRFLYAGYGPHNRYTRQCYFIHYTVTVWFECTDPSLLRTVAAVLSCWRRWCSSASLLLVFLWFLWQAFFKRSKLTMEAYFLVKARTVWFLPCSSSQNSRTKSVAVSGSLTYSQSKSVFPVPYINCMKCIPSVIWCNVNSSL